MKANRLPDYLDHMLDAARQACVYVEGMGKAEFMEDKRTQQAVIMNLMILGEVAAKLLEGYADFLARHTEVPWASMKGMRNRVAHGYFELDLDIVWETARTALPPLLTQLPLVREAAIAQTNSGNDG
jgi:uncharacterized protein with HEPN domain